MFKNAREFSSSMIRMMSSDMGVSVSDINHLTSQAEEAWAAESRITSRELELLIVGDDQGRVPTELEERYPKTLAVVLLAYQGEVDAGDENHEPVDDEENDQDQDQDTQDSEWPSPELVATTRALLEHSWKSIDFKYQALSATERLLVTESEFNELVKWVKGD